MRYTSDEKGILNNFAVEPKVYLAEYPTQAEQKNYIWQGAAAVVLLALAALTTIAASGGF